MDPARRSAGRTLRVLMTAYACSPVRGSEPSIGWGWATSIAATGVDVTVLTRPEWRSEIAAAGPQAGGPRFVYVGLPPRLAARDPELVSQAQYLLWLRLGLRAARRLHRNRPFDLAHHVSWGSAQAGSPLWRLGMPLVLGPVGGGQMAPPAFAATFGDAWGAETRRRLATRALLVSPVRHSAARAACCFAANSETVALLEALGARTIDVLGEWHLRPDEIDDEPPVPRTTPGLDLLWVGSLQARKAPELAVRAVAAVPPGSGVRLRVAGGGPLRARLEGLVAELGVGDRVTLLGRQPHTAMPALYRSADALLFTSLRDTGGNQLLEAAARGLPAVYLGTSGARRLVPEGTGEGVPLTTPEAAVEGLAARLADLAGRPERLATLAGNAWERARTQTWAGAARVVRHRYDEIMARA